MHIVLIGAVQYPSDPLFPCQLLKGHEKMAFAQITAVYRVHPYLFLFQFIHFHDLVDSSQFTGHLPGNP